MDDSAWSSSGSLTKSEFWMGGVTAESYLAEAFT